MQFGRSQGRLQSRWKRLLFGCLAVALASTGLMYSEIGKASAAGTGRIDIVARGPNGDVFHKYYSSGWSGWENIGGYITGKPVSVSWSTGRLDVFGRGPSGEVFHKYWNAGSGWSGWENIGGNITDNPAAVSRYEGEVEVFGRGPGGDVFRKTFLPGSGWGSWTSVGGYIVGSPTVASWNSNRVDLFGRGPNGDVFHSAWNSSGWSGWESLGGNITSSPAALSRYSGHVEVFGRGPGGDVFHKYWTASSGWSGWSSLGGYIVGDPAVASWGSDRMDVAGIGTSGSVFQMGWNSSSGWGSWANLGGNVNGIGMSSPQPAETVTRNVTSLGKSYTITIPSGYKGQAMNRALDQLGDPYVFGAAGPNSFDCSGLTMYAYAPWIGLPHKALSQSQVRPHTSKPTPGDLVYFNNPGTTTDHVGMYLGNGLFVNAPNSTTVVRIDKVSSWSVPAQYLQM